MLALSLGLSFSHPSTGAEYAQLVLRGLRLFLLAALPAVTVGFLSTQDSERGRDEEASPLLGHSQGLSDESQESVDTYGSTATKCTTGNTSTSTAQIDGLVQQEIKEELEGQQRLKMRLKETGNWWAYAKSYSVCCRTFLG